MPRLKNTVNDKERKTQCVATDGSICYKVPLGPEEDKLGHFIESEKVGNTMIFRFALKKNTPSFRIEQREPFQMSFD
jgi:hypothetical protein